tara:strand:- start:3286 stop:3444 length:159 start_codon:yes stop_codon:yes gene_type:complete
MGVSWHHFGKSSGAAPVMGLAILQSAAVMPLALALASSYPTCGDPFLSASST